MNRGWTAPAAIDDAKRGAMSRAAVRAAIEGRIDDDTEAAEAYEVFGRCVPAFGGVFCDAEPSSREPLIETLATSDVLPGWAGAWAIAVQDVDVGLGDRVADSVLAMETTQAAALPPPRWDGGDLDALIGFLHAPARCGMFVSVAVIERWGRALSVPRGFGSRRQMLRDLVESAARYGQKAPLFLLLAELAEDHRRRLPPAAAPYAERLGMTVPMLRSLG
jgi:hypothetical protein